MDSICIKSLKAVGFDSGIISNEIGSLLWIFILLEGNSKSAVSRCFEDGNDGSFGQLVNIKVKKHRPHLTKLPFTIN